MYEKITVSVIVPVYNAAAHLKKCVDSILGQTLPNLELILVDDGSSDDSGAICDAFSQDARVRVIHKQNGGPSQARNRGIEAARGEFIGFVDADDSVSLEMFKTLYDAAVSNGSDMAFCDYVALTKSGDINIRADNNGDKTYSATEIKKFILPYFFGYDDSELYRYKTFFPFADYSSYIWLCLYKTPLIRKNGLSFPNQNTYYNEDQLFNLNAVFHASRITHVAKFLYRYLDCDDSLTKRYNDNFLKAKLNRFDYMRRFIDDNGCDISYNRRLDNKICVESINIINYYINAAKPGISGKYGKIRETVNAPAVSDALSALNLKAVPFSKLSLLLNFEKHKACRMILLMAEAYRLWRR